MPSARRMIQAYVKAEAFEYTRRDPQAIDRYRKLRELLVGVK